MEIGKRKDELIMKKMVIKKGGIKEKRKEKRRGLI